MPHILNTSAKHSGAWRTVIAPYVNVAGTWKKCSDIYVKVNGAWQRVFSRFNIEDNTEYTGYLNFTSRDWAGAQGQGWFKFVPGSGWWTRIYVHQDSGGFASDTGWVNGSTAASANQICSIMILPTETSTHSVPILECRGNSYSNFWYARWCYSNELSTVENVTSRPAGWFGTGCWNEY
jgi:hypothetical protein